MSQRKFPALTLTDASQNMFQQSKMLDETGSMFKSQVSNGTHRSPFMAQNSRNGSGVTNNTSNLKGKLQSLEELIKTLAEELNYHKKEVQLLRSEKETLESVLTLKTQEVRKALTNENFKVEEEMKRHYAHQKAENSRIQ